MAGERDEGEPQWWPEQVIGAKYVRLLEKYLRQFRSDEAHGNRQYLLNR